MVRGQAAVLRFGNIGKKCLFAFAPKATWKGCYRTSFYGKWKTRFIFMYSFWDFCLLSYVDATRLFHSVKASVMLLPNNNKNESIYLEQPCSLECIDEGHDLCIELSLIKQISIFIKTVRRAVSKCDKVLQKHWCLLIFTADHLVCCMKVFHYFYIN